MREFRWRRVGARLAAGLLVLNLHPNAAGQQGAVREYREVHLGMELRLLLEDTGDATDAYARAAFDLVDSLDLVLSDWRPASELRRLETVEPGEWTPISPPLRDVLALALRVARRTGGRFDPTIGPLTRLWREERRTGQPATASAREAARARVDWRRLTLDSTGSKLRIARPGVEFDLGAIAKGWILDRTADSLARLGVRSVLLEAGGDIVARGHPPGADGWRIAVGDTVLRVSDAAISSSGPAMQWLREPDGTLRSHVIDPATGRGRSDGTAVTVIAGSGAVSDAVATALTLLPGEDWEQLLREFGATLVRVE